MRVSTDYGPKMEMSMKAVGIIALVLVLPSFASAQSSSARARTAMIVAGFDQFKHEVKDKRGVRKEKYKRIETAPVVRSDPRSYSGSYEAMTFGDTLDITVDSRGNVTGGGYQPLNIDGTVRRKFTLRDGRVDGALFTATKIFENGSRESIEGVFMNRTSYHSPTDTKGNTTFGLGVDGNTVVMGTYGVSRFFFTKE